MVRHETSEGRDRGPALAYWTDDEVIRESERLADQIAYHEGSHHPVASCLREMARRLAKIRASVRENTMTDFDMSPNDIRTKLIQGPFTENLAFEAAQIIDRFIAACYVAEAALERVTSDTLHGVEDAYVGLTKARDAALGAPSDRRRIKAEMK